MHTSGMLRFLVRHGKLLSIYIIRLFTLKLAALAQMVACLPLVQQVRGSIPGGVVNFNLIISTSGLGGVEMYTF